jgi:hypothetical protein
VAGGEWLDRRIRGLRAPFLPAVRQEVHPVMAFIQINEFRATDVAAARRFGGDWLRATERKR